MGKFDDFKKNGQTDQYEEDVYGDIPTTPQAVVRSNNMLNQKVRQQNVNAPTYEQVVEVEKTFDLKFVKGLLHQKVIERVYTLEVLSGESKLDKSTEKWIPVPSES